MEEQIMNPEQEAVPAAPAQVEVVDIQFRPGQKIYFFDPDGAVFAAGDHVIIDTARGAEFGFVTGGNHLIQEKDVVAPLRKVLRRATAQDEKVNAENRAKEARAHEICLQKIADHGLDMQLVSAEYAFDGSKILFYFTADERVDFRELVKNLASIFHTRIELRQIGVRDKAKMVGGLGICGRPFCCATFLEDFQPVSIKMAKTQNLSLNPTKISGTCGRLMCCLKYEQEAYEDLIRNAPKMDSFIDTPEGRGTVVDVDLLRSRVKVRMEENPETITWFANADIAVLRSGKAKKNDPPIPADLAPISGAGKRVRREREEEKLFLDPIKFRYSTEAVVEEQEEVKEEPAQANREGKSRRSRQNKKNQSEKPAPNEKKPENPKPEKEKKERREKEPKENKELKESPEASGQPETAEDAEQAKKPNRRRPNYRRYRKPKQSSDN